MLTREQVTDLLTGALEGGSNYWYLLDTENIYKCTVHLRGNPLVDRIIFALYECDQELEVFDNENGEYLGHLSLSTIKAGEDLMMRLQPDHFNDVINENDDADTADVWFQLCVMGEIVYG